MNSRRDKLIRLVKIAVFAGLVAWGVAAWWALRQARHAGALFRDTLAAAWPENASPQPDARDKLLAAAEDMRSGEFWAVASELGPPKPPSAQQTLAAQRLFAQARDLRRRFIAAAAAAQRQEDSGADVSAVRDALARALWAAAEKDQAGAAAYVQRAEQALDAIGMAGAPGSGAGDPEAVAALLRQIGPAFNLGRELMTEGHPAAEKLLARASWHVQAKEYRQAVLLMQLAAELLGVEPAAPAAAITPEWFDALAQAPSASVSEAQAQAAIDLCEAMVASEAPSQPVRALVEKARRELDAGRPAEAHWWASVALNALGMTDDAIAAAVDTPDQESPE